MDAFWLPSLSDIELVRTRVEARARLGTDPIEQGMLSPSVLESAVERATRGPFPDTPDLAVRVAFLLQGIAQEHPFVDGNKRTAFEVADITMQMNGRIVVASAEAIERFQVDIARGRLAIADMARWLERHSTSLKEGLQR